MSKKSNNRRKTGGSGIDPQLAQATQFKPRQSGNPSDRPKKSKFDDALKHILESDRKGGNTGAEELSMSVYRHAKAGNGKMTQLIAETPGGKAPQPVKIEEQIETTVNVGSIDAEIAELLRRAAPQESKS
jgi:hypothetical protein